MVTHPSVLAWRIPGTGEPGGLPSLGSHRVRHDWSDLAAVAAKSQMTLSSIPSLFTPWQTPSPMRNSSIPAFLTQDFLSPINKCGQSTVPKYWVGQKVCSGFYKQTNFLAKPSTFQKEISNWKTGILMSTSLQTAYTQHKVPKKVPYFSKQKTHWRKSWLLKRDYFSFTSWGFLLFFEYSLWN